MTQISDEDLVIQSRLERISDARRWLTEHARAAGFAEDAILDLRLVVSEALANVVEHAYGGASDQEIRLALVIDDEKLCLIIRDFGRKFDLAHYTAPDLDQPSEGGYGVFLMHELMDEVTYDTSPPTGTKLTLVRYRSASEEDQ
ncbi:MAG: ATP-binding protein [Anaerolineae bacterium]